MPRKKLLATGNERKIRQDLVLSQLFDESDRGAILVGGSILEECLENLLRAKLGSNSNARKKSIELLLATSGPISSFWGKIHLSFAIGLIESWIFEDLEVIRQLRNLAAHEYAQINFDNIVVTGLTKNLKGADYAVTKISEKPSTTIPKESGPIEDREKLREVNRERLRFGFSVAYIAGTLEERTIGPITNAR